MQVDAIIPRPPEAKLGNLDMTDGRDRALLLARIKEPRWGEITPEFKADAIRSLKVAMKWALEKQDHRAINGIVGTLGYLEGQNQKDDHKLLDATTPAPGTTFNGPVQIVYQNIPPSIV